MRSRELLADSAGTDSPDVAEAERLPASDVLELLALSEVIARKAGYGQQLAVRTARAAGASWTAIARALGTSKQAAWEAHTRWIDAQGDLHRSSGQEGLDPEEIARLRRLAGSPDDEPST
ncbi:MAG TPA: hypothetical protein VK640_09065 [Actinomycetes bacterium]|nr:hypothetical protein [Actinomycetes bacterium]